MSKLGHARLAAVMAATRHVKLVAKAPAKSLMALQPLMIPRPSNGQSRAMLNTLLYFSILQIPASKNDFNITGV